MKLKKEFVQGSQRQEMSAQAQETDRTYIVTEWCSNCENEIELRWDTDALGFKAYCPVCGNRLMLCDECRHIDGGPDCDYSSETDSCRFNPPITCGSSDPNEDEYRYLFAFIREGSFEDTDELNKLRVLWTAYCLRKGLTVGMEEYFTRVRKIWEAIQANGTSKFGPDDWGRFDNVMGGLL